MAHWIYCINLSHQKQTLNNTFQEMSHLFYNPYKPSIQDPLLSNEYDNPEYTFIGDVNSCIYKKWARLLPPHGEKEAFLTPDEQYYIKLNEAGNLDFIETHKDRQISRHSVDKKVMVKPGNEQPISYYQQSYSGRVKFFYNEKNKLLEYSSDLKFNNRPYKRTKKQFIYDENDNVHTNSDESKFIFNELGQLIAYTIGDESKTYYSKVVFEYDAKGRRAKSMEYGYLSDESDEDPDEIIYHLEKGIQLLSTAKYVYTSMSDNETKCVREINFWHEKDNNHLKQVVVFDAGGYKKYHEHYRFNGGLYQTSYYNFIFDHKGNWIKCIEDIAFGFNSNQRNQNTYERDITYN